MGERSDPVVAVVEAVTSRSVAAIHAPPGSGYTPARRFVAELDDGRRVFAKAALDQHIGGWIRAEIEIYRTVSAPCMPVFVGSGETEDGMPVLVLEDLSTAHWPPPWGGGSVDAVRAALDSLHAIDAPASVPTVGSLHGDLRDGWESVAADPAVLVRTGLCTERWLTDVVDHFRALASTAPLDGAALSHLDVRSDNLCFDGRGKARLVDWNHTCLAHAELDLAMWLPSLAAETGVDPERYAAVDLGLVAVAAGFFAARAGLPIVVKAPRVREVQRAQLAVALPWLARRCGLEAPDGPNAA